MERTITKITTQDIVHISIFAVLIALCSWISIPTVVPFTLQTMGVFTTVGVLGGKKGTLSVLIYILLGTIGVPVFAGFTGGIHSILGLSGGYIIGFLFSALLMWGMEKIFGRSRIVLILSMLLGLLVCYGFGTLWFLFIYTAKNGAIGIMTILGWCVIPFIIPDLLKIFVSIFLTEQLKKAIKE